jgi:hypothetical protein
MAVPPLIPDLSLFGRSPFPRPDGHCPWYNISDRFPASDFRGRTSWKLERGISMAEKKEPRFVEKKIAKSILNDVAEILVDTETGVNYLVVSTGFGGGVTPLLDSNGKVVIDK